MLVREWFYRRLAVGKNVTVGRSFHVGPGSRVWAPERLVVGNDVYIGKFCTVEVDGRIGDGTLIANSVGIIGRTDHDMNAIGVPIRWARWVGEFPTVLSLPTNIGSDCWIGFGAIVMSGVTIGDSSVIAAGSVVIDDVPPNSIMGGVPARFLKKRFDDDSLVRHWTSLHRHGVRLGSTANE